jgi:hypothetical protein
MARFVNSKHFVALYYSGSISYEVWADEDKLFDSGKMTSKSSPVNIDIDITNKVSLKLIITDAGNGSGGDVGMWVNPTLE